MTCSPALHQPFSIARDDVAWRSLSPRKEHQFDELANMLEIVSVIAASSSTLPFRKSPLATSKLESSAAIGPADQASFGT